MLKKTLLVLMILFLMNISAVVAAPIDIANDDPDYDAISVVTDLGIMDLNEDSAFRGDDTLTRAELAEIAAVLYGIDVVDADATSLYDDVAKDNKYGKYIVACHNYNLMNGTKERQFNPDGQVTADQLNAVIIRILGCEEFANNMGGYPVGYIETARYIGIGNYFAINSTTVTRRTCAKYLYEVLNVPVPNIKHTSNGTELLNNGTKTLSETHMKITKVEGLVTGNEFSALPEGTTTNRDDVQIAGKNMGVGDTDIMSRLGRYVEVYVKTDKDGNYGDVQSYILPKRFSDEITIKAKDINKSETNSSKISVDYERKTQTYTLDSNRTIILNGDVLATYSDDVFKINRGELTLADTNNSGKYNLIIINEPMSVIFNRYNADTGVMSFKYGTQPVEIDENAKVEVYIDDAESDLASLKEWMSLFIYKTQDGDYYRITASSKTVTGRLTSTYSSRNTFAVDGVEYGIAYDYSAYSQYFAGVQLGNTYTFLLTPYGEIVAVAKTKTKTDKYAYLMGGHYESEFGVVTVYLNLFTEDGENIIRTLKKKVKIDNGNEVKTYEGASILNVSTGLFDSDKKAIKQLVRFKEDNAECISEIKIAKDVTSENTVGSDVFTKNYSPSEKILYKNNTFQGLFYLPDDVVVFKIPSEKTNGVVYPSNNLTDIRIVSPSTYQNKEMNNFELYDVDSFRRAGAMVLYDEKGSANTASLLINSEILVVSENALSVLPNGDLGYVIKGYRDGKQVEFTAEPDLVSISWASWQWGDYAETPISDIKPGHIIHVSTVNNNIDDFLVIGDLALINFDHERVATTTITTANDKCPNGIVTIPGVVKDVEDKYVLVSTRAGNGETCDRLCNILSYTEVYIFNSNTGEVVLADYSAIIPGDKIFVRTHDWTMRAAVIVR